MFKILRNPVEYCVQESEKNSAFKERKGSKSHSEQREGREEIKFCSVNRGFSIFCVTFCNNDAVLVAFNLLCLKSLGFI